MAGAPLGVAIREHIGGYLCADGGELRREDWINLDEQLDVRGASPKSVKASEYVARGRVPVGVLSVLRFELLKIPQAAGVRVVSHFWISSG